MITTLPGLSMASRSLKSRCFPSSSRWWIASELTTAWKPSKRPRQERSPSSIREARKRPPKRASLRLACSNMVWDPSNP